MRRAFLLAPNAATVACDDLRRDASLLRAVRPEARVTLDEREYTVGGLVGQREQGYLLPAWLDELQAEEGGFALSPGDLDEAVGALLLWPILEGGPSSTTGFDSVAAFSAGLSGGVSAC